MGNWSRIFYSPSLVKFLDPSSLFSAGVCVFARRTTGEHEEEPHNIFYVAKKY